jgi:hypothetical protein
MMRETGGNIMTDMRTNNGYGNNGVKKWMMDMRNNWLGPTALSRTR